MNILDAPREASLLRKRILLVAHDDYLYQALRDSLQDAGYAVLGSCERVCDPIDTVPASRLDAALVDMDPLGSGRAASLGQQFSERNIPVVWITSRHTSAVAPLDRTHEWLSKPFTERQLLDSMEMVLAPPALVSTLVTATRSTLGS